MKPGLRTVGLDRVAAAMLPEDAVIAVPDCLGAAAMARWPDRRVLPHHGLLPGMPLPDLTLLHKDLLDRLSRPVLAALLRGCRPVLATEDILLLRPALRVAAGAVPPSWQAEMARLRERAELPLLPRPEPSGTALIVAAYGEGDVGEDAATVVAGRIAAKAGFARVVLAGPEAGFDLARRADLVVLAGGEALRDTEDGQPRPEHVSDTAGLLRHAQELGRVTAALGVGVGTLRSADGMAAYAQALGRCRHVSVRDPGALRLVREELGVGQARLAADAGFGLDPWVWPAAVPEAGRPLALVVPRGPDGEAEAGWAGLIRALGRSQEVVVVQHARRDRALCERLAALTGARLEALAEHGVMRAPALYRRAGTVVTADHHGLLFGLLAGCRLLPVAAEGGPQARLIRWALPSLRPALMSPDRIPEAEALLAAVAQPDPAEVAALQGRVMELPAQLAAAMLGPRALRTTMDSIRAALAARPEAEEEPAMEAALAA
ncbi:polysaccharide pyruvyl transferase family protein [Roseicella aquatilis]|uniref:Polysaccharide pyruvyl transferase domain-containing protein n=1 Tax=Roseicella aquatilis TaxID=2527868 RepID=A0A4R4DND7_9PROT|nr:polysaccharide pyruvyl transferase family protein [Roseicella aquatilis]TCZ62934.1 hypothetical protein EXY23_11140 [Roseicella aquatilis]